MVRSMDYYKYNTAAIEKITNMFADNKSRNIYDYLVKLNISHDLTYLEKAVAASGIKPDKGIASYLEFKHYKATGKSIVLYGIGRMTSAHFSLYARHCSDILPGYLFFPFAASIDWDAFCDKEYVKFEKGFYGKPVIAPKDIPHNAIIAVSVTNLFDEIRSELIGLGYSSDQIVPFFWGNTKIYEDEQYFDVEFMKPCKENVFIDGGCFRCDSIERFLQWNHGYGYDEIISFEPDPLNYSICKEKAINLGRNINILNAGLSDKNINMTFSSNGDDTSSFNLQGDITIPLTTIDDTVCGENVSFIKLDVEGFELEALKGGSKTIQNCHPRIACCLYHKYNDLIDIPQYIASLSNQYEFYLRMYADEYLEIVLYAI